MPFFRLKNTLFVVGACLFVVSCSVMFYLKPNAEEIDLPAMFDVHRHDHEVDKRTFGDKNDSKFFPY